MTLRALDGVAPVVHSTAPVHPDAVALDVDAARRHRTGLARVG